MGARLRTHSDIMDEAIRAYYADDAGGPRAASIRFPGEHAASPAPRPAHLPPPRGPDPYAPPRASDRYATPRAPVDQRRVQPVANEDTWRTWSSDQGPATHPQNWIWRDCAAAAEACLDGRPRWTVHGRRTCLYPWAGLDGLRAMDRCQRRTRGPGNSHRIWALSRP